MSEQPQPWPDGVIARYAAIGGATVDITTPHTERQVGEHATVPIGGGLTVQKHPETVIDVTVTVRCSACPDAYTCTHPGLFPSALKGLVDSHYGREARNWAQKHAERCRALPKPGATQ